MPTDRGLRQIKPPAPRAEQAFCNAHDRTVSPLKRLETSSRLAVGVGLHLTVPGLRRDGRAGKSSSHEPSSSTSAIRAAARPVADAS
jgi:hypothetical protein